MRVMMCGALAAFVVTLGGCADQPMSAPPSEIAQSCVAFGEVLFQTEEWLKPATHGADEVRWEKAEGGYIVRISTSNPLNRSTREVSILFVQTAPPAQTAPYCQGYIIPQLGDVDGQPLSGLAVAVSQNGALMPSIARYRGQVPTEAPIVEWPPAGAAVR